MLSPSAHRSPDFPREIQRQREYDVWQTKQNPTKTAKKHNFPFIEGNTRTHAPGTATQKQQSGKREVSYRTERSINEPWPFRQSATKQHSRKSRKIQICAHAESFRQTCNAANVTWQLSVGMQGSLMPCSKCQGSERRFLNGNGVICISTDKMLLV